ncbi:MAG: shikimate dehydrogenase [Candidatus Aureabacteria bacterium]|nr:shikimate dehydrogenase [Candidatus Auribacterota bacterium]
MKKKKRKGKLLRSYRKEDFSRHGNSSLYGIVGFPLKHTASPAMHNSLFRFFRMPAVYIPIELAPHELKLFFPLIRILFHGVNVTVPHKKAVIPFLDDVDAHSRAMDSVNTIRNSGGVLKGFNTDFIGLRMALRDAFQLKIKGKDVCILGAGGAAASAVYLSLCDGARNIFLINRTFEKALHLAAGFAMKGAGITVVRRDAPEAEECVRRSEIVLQTTSLGLRIKDPLPVEKGWLRSGQFVFDMIYNPPVTRFMKLAKKADCRVAGGIDMLVYQGAESFRIWTGKKPDPAIMKKAVLKVIY